MALRLVAMVAALSTLVLARPAIAEYVQEATRVDWFVAVSDTHIGASGDRAVENLSWLVREGYQAIQPSMVVNCGDLTDATGFLIPTGPQEDEWQEYQRIVDEAGMTPATYLDLPGNHDQYGDKGLPHYLQYSVQGRADGQTQHSVLREGPSGAVHLLASSTPANNGGGVLADRASLDAGELAFLQKALDDTPDATVRLFFGHHPVDRDIGNSIEEGKEEFQKLLETFDATAYVYGHTHSYQSEFRGRTLHLNLDALGKTDKDHVAILALDAGTLSARAFPAARWPYVVITAPADVTLGGSNPRAYTIPANWTDCPVRALVFGDKPPDGVRFRLDDGPWVPMAEAQPHVWASTFDSTGLGAGHHSLRVQASPWNDNDHVIAFRVGVTSCSNDKDDDNDGLTDWPDDPGCLTPSGDDEAATPAEWPDEPGVTDTATPADAPLADVPLADAPLADVPLADEPLADEPLADVPLADVPLADVPSTDIVSPEASTADVPVLPPDQEPADAPAPEMPGPGDEVLADAPGTPPDESPLADTDPQALADAPATGGDGADAGLDSGPGYCLAGAMRCEGATVQTCAADGRTWTPVESCSDRGLDCGGGRCLGAAAGGCNAGERPRTPMALLFLLAATLLPFALRRREVRS